MVRLALLLMALLFLAPRPGLTADEARTALSSADLRQLFEYLLVRDGFLPQGEVEVSNFSASPDSLPLPAGELDFRTLSQSEAKQLGRQSMVVEVLVDGQSQGRVALRGDLTRHGEVVTACQPLERNRILGQDDLCLVRRNLTMLGPELVTDPSLAVGKELKTSLQAGAVLYARSLKQPTLVKRGEVVTIVAGSDSLRITVPGRVMNAAALGERVRVKNMMSRREVEAKVVGPGLVVSEM